MEFAASQIVYFIAVKDILFAYLNTMYLEACECCRVLGAFTRDLSGQVEPVKQVSSSEELRATPHLSQTPVTAPAQSRAQQRRQR